MALLLSVWGVAAVVIFLRCDDLPMTVLIAAAAIIGVAAFWRPPVGTDLWFYQAQGRLISEYAVNPYVATPAMYPSDVVMGRVDPLYQASTSPYGPAFAVAATAVAATTGTSEPVGRVAWQLVGAGAVAAGLLAARCAGASPKRCLALSMAPFVVYQQVHLAHNDALAGAALACGAVPLLRSALPSADRQGAPEHSLTSILAASVMLAVAALIKPPTGVALLVVWGYLLSARRWSLLAASITSSAAISLLVSAPFGISKVLQSFRSAGTFLNDISLVHLVNGDVGVFIWRSEPSGQTYPNWIAPLAIAAVALGALALGWVSSKGHLPVAICAALILHLLVALSPAPWFTGWLVPLMLLCGSTTGVRLVAYASWWQVAAIAQLMPIAALVLHGGPTWYSWLNAPMLGLLHISSVAAIVMLYRQLRRPHPIDPHSSGMDLGA
jgi:alpha-1,6-mannosyltransferase